MKKLLFFAGLIVLTTSAIVSQDLKLEEILEKYYKANGFDALLKVNTIVMSGTNIQQDAMLLKVTRMRPDKYLMAFDVQDITAYQGYDGQTAWWTTPWTGNPKPQVMPEERAKDLRARSDFDTPIFDWKRKGHQAELTGVDTLGKMPVYKIKLTRKDGGVEYYLIDNKDFMLQKKLTYRMLRGKETEIETVFSDYRKVKGVWFAFKTEMLVGGQPYSQTQFDVIDLNPPVDEKIFKMPAAR